jgi:hypothetical protein
MKTFIRLAAMSTLAVAFALTAVPADATAGSSPSTRWHLTYRSEIKGMSSVIAVAASGPKNVWALQGPALRNYVYQWNGRFWRTRALPANFSGDLIATSAPTNVWVVGNDQPSGTSVALRWDGSSWKTIAMPAFFPAGYAVAAAPSQLWIAVDNGTLLHWTGARWLTSKYEFPGWQSLANIGGQVWRTDFGRIGGQNDRLILRRWNGASWQLVRSPHPAAGHHAELAISGSSPSNIWVTTPVRGGSHYEFLHWNGGKWSEVGFPAFFGVFGGVAAVGRSSVWLASESMWSDGQWIHGRPDLGCLGVTQVTGVPGTSSAVCVTGIPNGSQRVQGQVWITGHLP